MKRRTFLKALGAAVVAPVSTVKAVGNPKVTHVIYSHGDMDAGNAWYGVNGDWGVITREMKDDWTDAEINRHINQRQREIANANRFNSFFPDSGGEKLCLLGNKQ